MFVQYVTGCTASSNVTEAAVKSLATASGRKKLKVWSRFETYQTFVRFLPSVDKVMLLKVGQLSEALLAQVALKGPLTAVHS